MKKKKKKKQNIKKRTFSPIKENKSDFEIIMEKIKYFNPKMRLRNSRKWVNFYWTKTFYSPKIAMQAIAEANLIIFNLNKKSV